MDKLLNISRQEGFPLCAETVEALNNNTRYIEAIMDGFGLVGGTPQVMKIRKQAIILSEITYMYLMEGDTKLGKIVKTFTQIPSGSPDYPTRAKLLTTPRKYDLIKRSEKISINKQNSNTEIYPDCIERELYEIVLLSTEIKCCEFYEMADFFAAEKMITIPHNSLEFNGVVFNPLSMFGNIYCDKFGTKLDIQLSICFDSTTNKTISIKIPEEYVVNAPSVETILTASIGKSPDNSKWVPATFCREQSFNKTCVYIYTEELIHTSTTLHICGSVRLK